MRVDVLLDSRANHVETLGVPPAKGHRVLVAHRALQATSELSASGDREPDEAVGKHASVLQLHRRDRREWNPPVARQVSGATEALPVDRQPVAIDRDHAVAPLGVEIGHPLTLPR